MNNHKFNAVSDFLQKEVDEERLLGNAISVGNHAGVIFSSQHGDIEGNTLCRLYSLSKTVAAVAAWILIDRGLMHLDDKVSDFLPYFDDLTIMDENGTRPAKEPLRICNLLHMTTGIPYTPVAVKIHTEPANQLLIMIRHQIGRFLDGENVTSEDIYRALSKNPIEFEPGTRWRYGMSCDVLGGVMEAITKKRLDDFYKEEIFAPLEMHNSGFRCPDNCKFAKMGEIGSDGKIRELNAKEMYPGDYADGSSFGDSAGGGWFFEGTYGGLYSTCEDLTKLCTMLLNGGTYNGKRILKRETVAGFQQNQLSPELLETLLPKDNGYGYNSYLRVLMDDTKKYSPSCKGEFGGLGYMGCYCLVDPAADLFIVYMQQCATKTDITEKLKELIYEAL